jgi:toxin ParE1/3/4
VPVFRLTRRAEADLFDIADFTLRTWGEAQCALYVDQLEVCLQRLADDPLLGRARDRIHPGLRSIGQGKHVVFYKCVGDEILVLRILHERMVPELHVTDDEE